MTDTEAQNLNEKIAYVLGWQYRPDGPQGECWVGRDGLVEANPHLPDFCRNVREIGYLLEWVDKKTGAVFAISLLDTSWSAVFGCSDSNDLPFFGYGATAGEALCRAILAYTEKPT